MEKDDDWTVNTQPVDPVYYSKLTYDMLDDFLEELGYDWGATVVMKYCAGAKKDINYGRDNPKYCTDPKCHWCRELQDGITVRTK